MHANGTLHFGEFCSIVMTQLSTVALVAKSPQVTFTDACVCVSGWEQHRDDCYKVLGERLTWNEGEKVCEEQQQGHLAHVETSKHLEWLWKMADHEPFWIGKSTLRYHVLIILESRPAKI